MSYSLVIVESPAKCNKIQGFLGPGWKVIATMGHIRSLEEGLDGIGIDRDFEPRYAFLKEKSKAIQAIRDAAKNASTVFLASDDDREGEAISFSVAALLKLDIAKTPRIVFHEITENAIKSAIRAPRRIDIHRVEAQQARSVLDMMVGFTISPLLWKFVGPALSAGRCQTPALRLLVEKERDIASFKSETSWKVGGTWSSGRFTFEAALHDLLGDEESALNYIENIHDTASGTITQTKTVPRLENPPKPLITSTLQQEASALFGFGPKITMSAAQKLYEQGYITYMRTDSCILSEDAVKEGQAYILETFGKTFLGSATGVKNAAKAQEAHEAIRPTHITTTSVSDDMGPNEIRIYKLIWQRTLQSMMAPCRMEEHTVFFKADGDPDEFQWKNMWKRMLFAGWKQVGLARVNLDLDDDENGSTEETKDELWKTVTALKEGERLTWKTLTATPQESRAAARFTEATLVRELEKRGIGRPSTFASLISTLLEKKYSEKKDIPARDVTMGWHSLDAGKEWPPIRNLTKRKIAAEKQRLLPSILGITVLDFCIQKFPDLFAYTFTEHMENRLDKVADGTEPWKEVCRDTWGSYREKLLHLKQEKAEAKPEKLFCGGIKAIRTRKGDCLLLKEGATKEETIFYGWPTGIKFDSITEEHVAKHLAETGGSDLGSYKEKPILKKKGPFGWYVQWNGISVNIAEHDTHDTVVQKIEAKTESHVHTLGKFEFRKGPYGIYMFSKHAKNGKPAKGKPEFVNIPSGLDPKLLTEEAAARIYETALKQKKARAK